MQKKSGIDGKFRGKAGDLVYSIITSWLASP